MTLFIGPSFCTGVVGWQSSRWEAGPIDYRLIATGQLRVANVALPAPS